MRITTNLGLPNADHGPAELPELARIDPIALPVSLDLRDPILCIRSNDESLASLAPASTVPEVAVDKYDRPRSRKDHIRIPW